MAGPWTVEKIEQLAAECCRWGRWGDDDELGALNLITPAEVAAAAGLVRTGQVISCALPFDSAGPQPAGGRRFNPRHYMLQDGGDIALGAQDHLAGMRFTDDAITMALQGGTHWDAFSHIFYRGRMYNGYGLEHVPSAGAQRCAVQAMSGQLVGRGVLLDIARARGVDWLENGEGIGGDELSSCAEEQGVKVGRGDILLVRTGRLARARSEGWQSYVGGDAPGLDMTSARYLVEREIAAVAADTYGVEVRPYDSEAVDGPLHVVLLVHAGIPLGEMFDLDQLAEECASDGVYEFLFVAAPLPFTGAVGGPANPMAIR